MSSENCNILHISQALSVRNLYLKYCNILPSGLSPSRDLFSKAGRFRPFPALSISAKEFPAVYPLFATETQLGSTFPLATQAFREWVEG